LRVLHRRRPMNETALLVLFVVPGPYDAEFALIELEVSAAARRPSAVRIVASCMSTIVFGTFN